jgi:hypothetical protein
MKNLSTQLQTSPILHTTAPAISVPMFMCRAAISIPRRFLFQGINFCQMESGLASHHTNTPDNSEMARNAGICKMRKMTRRSAVSEGRLQFPGTSGVVGSLPKTTK